MTATQTESVQDHNKRILSEWFRSVWEQDDQATIQRVYGTNAVLHDGTREYRGPAEFLNFYNLLTSRFSDFTIQPIVELAEGDLACKHFLVECTYKPTKQRVKFTAVVIVRIEKGQFTEAWQNWDADAITQQIPSFKVG